MARIFFARARGRNRLASRARRHTRAARLGKDSPKLEIDRHLNRVLERLYLKKAKA